MLEYVQKLRQQGGLMKVRSAHTAGSIIRAYGAMGDIKGVWDTWNELRLHGEKEAGGENIGRKPRYSPRNHVCPSSGASTISNFMRPSTNSLLDVRANPLDALAKNATQQRDRHPKDLKQHEVAPTRITLGCMVEALASNNDPDGAYEVIQTALADPNTKGW